MKYRPEIDGLRAIAVLSVLVYHAKFALTSGVLVSGGFLGVDIFFVISGFLITRILLQSIRSDSFSYLDFYDRRARRILPALFIVMIASTPFAWLTMLPDQLIEYAQSVLGALFFSSNFVFLAQDSYTAEPSALKPFLHTWSLGIEEQFYIILPVVLLLIVKRCSAKTSLLIISSALLVSLTFAQAISKIYPDANFFLISSRAWELLAGSVVAFIDLDHREDLGQKTYAGLVSGIALAVLIAALFLFDEGTRHPSLLTALPVLACAALIAYGNGVHWVNRLLSLPIMLKLGLISYSLYLWHFPLFAFYRLHIGEPNTIIKLGLMAASILLAVFGYRFVETPFRNREKLRTKASSLILFVTFIVIATFQISVLHNNGYGNRLGNIEEFVSEAQAIRVNNGAAPDTPRNPLVSLGDSHAGIFSHPLKTLASELGRPFVQVVQDGCPLVEGMSLYTDHKHVPRCENIYQPRWDAISHFNDGIYFYSGRFALYLEGTRFAEEPGYPVLMTNQEDQQPAPEALLDATVATIKTLLEKNIKTVLVYPIPEMGFDVPKKFINTFKGIDALKLKPELADRPLRIKKQAYLERASAVIKAFDSIGEHENLVRLNPADLFCDENYCYAHDSDILYYYDDNHLSPMASDRLIRKILPELKKRDWLN